MQFSNTLIVAAIGVFFSTPALAANSAMPPPMTVNDLQSCLKYAGQIPNPTAQRGWENGCHNAFGNAAQQNVSARSIEADFDMGIQKRCKSEHGSCCCQQFCLDEVSCPVCIAGCEASCTTQYGGDCTGYGSGSCPGGECT